MPAVGSPGRQRDPPPGERAEEGHLHGVLGRVRGGAAAAPARLARVRPLAGLDAALHHLPGLVHPLLRRAEAPPQEAVEDGADGGAVHQLQHEHVRLRGRGQEKEISF